MVWKDKHKFHTPHHMTIITLLLIGIITSGTLFAFPLVLLNQSHAAMAQQPQQFRLMVIQLSNTTFSHNLATVNGIQLHYVIGGHGPPVVLLHG